MRGVANGSSSQNKKLFFSLTTHAPYNFTAHMKRFSVRTYGVMAAESNLGPSVTGMAILWQVSPVKSLDLFMCQYLLCNSYKWVFLSFQSRKFSFYSNHPYVVICFCVFSSLNHMWQVQNLFSILFFSCVLIMFIDYRNPNVLMSSPHPMTFFSCWK